MEKNYAFNNVQNISINTVYTLRSRITWALLALLTGIIIAGFWNYRIVDGFGSEIVAGNIIGDTSRLADTFNDNGFGFGILFAVTAGLAATFTACNCVIFAMLPGLTCPSNKSNSRKAALKALGIFSIGVIVVTGIYGLYIGSLGIDGVQTFNERQVRLAQASTIFTGLGLVMLIWGAISFGFLNFIITRIPVNIRTFFANPLTKAGLMGLMVGFFTVGRPFGVFRDFITYTASTKSPIYSALSMIIQGIGQIALMIIIFLVVIIFFGKRIARWSIDNPQQTELLSTFSLILGGAYFVYYWGVAIPFDLGRWFVYIG